MSQLDTAPKNGCPAILLSEHATGAWWQLGALPPRHGAFPLIGWNGGDVDGALQPAILNTLASAIVAFGRVTFPSSTVGATPHSGWVPRGTDYVVAFSDSSAHASVRRLFDRAVPASKHMPLRLLSTVQQPAVHGLFDDAEYPW